MPYMTLRPKVVRSWDEMKRVTAMTSRKRSRPAEQSGDDANENRRHRYERIWGVTVDRTSDQVPDKTADSAGDGSQPEPGKDKRNTAYGYAKYLSNRDGYKAGKDDVQRD